MADLALAYRDEALRAFRQCRKLAEGALDQVDDAAFFRAVDPESNSLALIVKHLAGNLRSRWTDFLTADGEKPDRDRDQEFEAAAADTREALMAAWAAGWETLEAALGALRAEDFGRTVTIRGEPHSVVQALNRQVAHYAYHVGQIVFLAKHLKGAAWRTLSVPKGGTKAFNAEMAARFRG